MAGEVNRLETEEDMRLAFSELRGRGKAAFAKTLSDALLQFVEKNNGMLPADLSQLRPFLNPPVDAAMLDRYQLLQSGKLSDVAKNAMVIAETAPPADAEYDTQNQLIFSGSDIQFLLRRSDKMPRMPRGG